MNRDRSRNISGDSVDNHSIYSNLNYNIDIWKKIVDTQQHFNTIEMQIRNFAVTVLAGIIAAAGFALRDPQYFSILGLSFSTASLIFFSGIFVLFGFYFMDRFWYHRLLLGSVKAGESLESMLKDTFPGIILSRKIRDESPVRIKRYEVHSTNKIDIFYGVIFLFLIIATYITSNSDDDIAKNNTSDVGTNIVYIDISYPSNLANTSCVDIIKTNDSKILINFKYTEHSDSSPKIEGDRGNA